MNKQERDQIQCTKLWQTQAIESIIKVLKDEIELAIYKGDDTIILYWGFHKYIKMFGITQNYIITDKIALYFQQLGYKVKNTHSGVNSRIIISKVDIPFYMPISTSKQIDKLNIKDYLKEQEHKKEQRAKARLKAQQKGLTNKQKKQIAHSRMLLERYKALGGK